VTDDSEPCHQDPGCPHVPVQVESAVALMRWHETMAGRLWLGFISLSVFMMGAAAIVYANLSRHQTPTAAIMRETGPLMVGTSQARTAFGNAQQALLEFIATGEHQFRVSYGNSRAGLARALARSQAAATGPSLVDLGREIRSATAWFNFGDRMLTLPSGSAASRGLALAGGASADAFYAANSQLIDRLLAQARAAARQGQGDVRSVVLWGGAAGVLAWALGLLACAEITGAGTRPLARLAGVMRKIASGDHTQRPALTGAAEVRELARSVIVLVDKHEQERTEEGESRRLAAAAREAGIRIRAHLDLTEVLREGCRDRGVRAGRRRVPASDQQRPDQPAGSPRARLDHASRIRRIPRRTRSGDGRCARPAFQPGIAGPQRRCRR
jgi:hypothetical protein